MTISTLCSYSCRFGLPSARKDKVSFECQRQKKANKIAVWDVVVFQRSSHSDQIDKSESKVKSAKTFSLS